MLDNFEILKLFAANGHNMTVKNGKHLRVFVETSILPRYKGEIDDYFEDILSQIEQEICYESPVFFYSEHSTWSSNLLLERGLDIGKKSISNFRLFQ